MFKYMAVQTFGVSKIFFSAFVRSLLCSPRLHLLYLKKKKKQSSCEILLHFKVTVFYVNIFNILIYSCDGKAEFLALLLQSSVSHDPSEIILICWFGAQETIIVIISNVENSCAA